MKKRKLIIIPAREGSKGLPGKNTKLLLGIPLVRYSINFAKEIKSVDDIICISTDDEKIIKIVEDAGISVPFVRPKHLSSDTAGTRDVILHALEFYESRGNFFDQIVLLQPTSPYRLRQDYNNMLDMMKDDIDMVVSVRQSKDNPYFNLYEENSDGFLKKSKESMFIRRQDAPSVYAFNGSIYIINSESFKKNDFDGFVAIVKYEMTKKYSIDIDTEDDFLLAAHFGEPL